MDNKTLLVGYQHDRGCRVSRLEALDIAANEGAEVLELSFQVESPSSVSAREGQLLRERAREAGVVLQIHAPISEPYIGTPAFATTLLVAEMVGADRVTIHASHLLALGPTEAAALFDDARQRTVVIGVENCYAAARNPEKVVEYLEGLKGETSVGMTFDVGHVNLGGQRALSHARAAVERLVSLQRSIVNVHLHDNGGEVDEHLVPGAGTVDFPVFLALLVSAGANRFVIEHWDEKRVGLERVRAWLAG